jgi:hypothetical protein
MKDNFIMEIYLLTSTLALWSHWECEEHVTGRSSTGLVRERGNSLLMVDRVTKNMPYAFFYKKMKTPSKHREMYHRKLK